MCEIGKRQSPIAIDSDNAFIDASLGPLQFLHYEKLRHGLFTNNGHSVVFTLDNQENFDGKSNLSALENGRPMIKGGGLVGEYYLTQLHFHWGNGSVGQGSEHVVNGKAAPLEVHFVHFNSKYESLAEALKFDDGVAAVAFLFAEEKSLNHETDYNQFDNLINQVTHEEDLSKFFLSYFLPISQASLKYSSS